MTDHERELELRDRPDYDDLGEVARELAFADDEELVCWDDDEEEER